MNRKDAVGLAVQIVYEYEDWGDEHVSDMMQTFEDCGDTPPCTGDELLDLCARADNHKRFSHTYQETANLMLKKGKK